MKSEIINCYECNAQISSSAINCPKCATEHIRGCVCHFCGGRSPFNEGIIIEHFKDPGQRSESLPGSRGWSGWFHLTCIESILAELEHTSYKCSLCGITNAAEVSRPTPKNGKLQLRDFRVSVSNCPGCGQPPDESQKTEDCHHCGLPVFRFNASTRTKKTDYDRKNYYYNEYFHDRCFRNESPKAGCALSVLALLLVPLGFLIYSTR